MLSSVLPGLRELRAPVAAGFLWLMTLWFACEGFMPDPDTASGAFGAALRLQGMVETIGLGAAISFGAYLTGSLSVFTFSEQLRRIMRTSADARWSWRDTLSPGALQALQLVAADAADRLNRILSLSGIDIIRAIDQSRPSMQLPGPRALRLPVPAWLSKWRRPRGRRHLSRVSSAFEQPAKRERRRLAQLVISDLPAIASTRLLGKNPDVFSAVDRDRAEIDFRLAVAPPLLALSASIAGRESPQAGAAIVAVGFVVAVGTVLDAIRRQRKANDLMLDLLQVKQIRSPSLEQIEAWAADYADRSPSKVLARHGRNIAAALPPLLEWIEWGRLSAPASALAGVFDDLTRVQGELGQLSGYKGSEHAVALGRRLLRRVGRIARAWAEFNHGALGDEGLALPPVEPEDGRIDLLDVAVLRVEVGRARQEFVEFGDQLQAAIMAAARLESTNRPEATE